jgi:hypothetical protein
MLPLIPIFDTNVVGKVQDGLISRSDWQFLLLHRPGHGWPLSAVTALERLVGTHDVPSECRKTLKGMARALNNRSPQILKRIMLVSGSVICAILATPSNPPPYGGTIVTIGIYTCTERCRQVLANDSFRIPNQNNSPRCF